VENGVVFAHIAVHRPRPEHRDALRASMRRVNAAAEGAPGLVSIGDWEEDDGDRLVGLSVWESRASWEAAAPAIFAAVADDPFDVWEAEPPESLHLER
jgi:hypothetical protein